jgi:hypothetical protein
LAGEHCARYCAGDVGGERGGRGAGEKALLTRYAERWLEAWETFSAEVDGVERPPAADRALAALRFRGSGTEGGVEIDERGYWVYELRGGRLYRISEYNDRAEALEAVGLLESQN